MQGQCELFSESIFESGSRCGFWRLLDLFEQHQINITTWASGMALEKNPELARHLATQGHEIAGHGYRWIDYSQFDPELEREHIDKTLTIIKRYTGSMPWGWYTGRKSLQTRQLIQAAGLRYDSESYADDLPYWQVLSDKPHLIIPYSFDVNDAKYYLTPGWMSGDSFLNYLINTVSCLYRESKKTPKMMTISLNARISDHPARAEVIHRFLDHLADFPDIWICTRQQIAQHWYQYHPYRNKRD